MKNIKTLEQSKQSTLNIDYNDRAKISRSTKQHKLESCPRQSQVKASAQPPILSNSQSELTLTCTFHWVHWVRLRKIPACVISKFIVYRKFEKVWKVRLQKSLSNTMMGNERTDYTFGSPNSQHDTNSWRYSWRQFIMFYRH